MTEARRLTHDEIEERRKNLAFIRENAPGDSVGDHLFTTSLLMQEQWLATVDALVSREGELVAALENARMLCKNDHAYDNKNSQVFEAVQVMNRALQGEKE